jgi:hypothetical protein
MNENERKCHGIEKRKKKIPDCKNNAIYEVLGIAAQFSAPLPIYLCEDCLKVYQKVYPDGVDTIMEYNHYPLMWRKIKPDNYFVDINGNKYDDLGDLLSYPKEDNQKNITIGEALKAGAEITKLIKEQNPEIDSRNNSWDEEIPEKIEEFMIDPKIVTTIKNKFKLILKSLNVSENLIDNILKEL